MYRLAARCTLFVMLLMGSVVVVALFIGQGVPVKTVVTSSRTDQIQTLPRDYLSSQFLGLIDLNRFLAVRIFPPLSGIDNLQLIIKGGDAYALIRTNNYQERSVTEGLYFYNIQTNELKTLIKTEGENRLTNVVRYGVYWSRDNERFAYHEAESKQLVIMNVETGIIEPVADVSHIRFADITRIGWSHAGDQIGFTHGNTLYIVNTDGSNLRAFEQDFANFYYFWSPDDTQIMVMGNPTSPNTVTRIINAQTGEPHPIVSNLQGDGISVSWFTVNDLCKNDLSDEWIAYRVHTGGESKPDMLLVNIASGDTINLNENPLLEDERISYVTWWWDCKTLLITAGEGGIYTPQPQNNRIYRADLNGENVSFLFEGGLMVGPPQDNPLFYQTVRGDAAGRPMFEVYRKDLTSDAPAELIGTHTLIQPFFQWVNDSRNTALLVNYPGSPGMRSLLYVDIAGGYHFPLTPESEEVMWMQVWDW